MYSIQIALLSVALLNLILGFFIFYRNRIKIINVSYFLVSLSTAVWSFGMLMYYRSGTDSGSVLFWSKILYFAGSLVAPFFLWFVINYIDKKIEKIFPHFILLMLPSALIFYLLYANLIIAGVNFFPGNSQLLLGAYWWVYYFQFFLYFTWAFIILLKHFLNSFGIEKTKTFYIFIGSLIPCVGTSVVNMVLPYFGNYKYAWFGPVFLLFLMSNIFYAIVRYQFLDIKMVMRRYSVYLASLSVVLVLATAVKYLTEIYFYDYSAWADPLILVAALFIFPPIRNRFYKLANKYFFSSLYDSGEVIASLSDKLRSTLETEKIYEFIYQTLTNAFHVKAFGLLIYNEADKNYFAEYNNGFTLNGQKIFSDDKQLTQMFIRKNQPIITEDAGRISELNGNKTIELLNKLGVEILSPLNVKDKTIGLIALGKKESGDMYNDEDLKVLEVVGAQTAIALENALLYKETKDFSIKLEKEVEKATRDLKKANAQLKKLDAAKSEFISIASHQLRTPLTVIKGYISMMLEGNFGGLTKPEEESLAKVYESNERLIQLVEDLLNISRIESGRLQFNYRQTDLNKMAASVVDELSGNAKKKNLSLEYQAPAKPVPLLKLDDEKIRQVAMNLIDNGIKYTTKGKVMVTLEQAANKIKFCVADSGMGIKPEDMVNLFKKFSRGSGTSLLHTEGTGLGLYVARMMVEAHHGKIWAESKGEGKGSKFCFELPVK